MDETQELLEDMFHKKRLTFGMRSDQANALQGTILCKHRFRLAVDIIFWSHEGGCYQTTILIHVPTKWSSSVGDVRSPHASCIETTRPEHLKQFHLFGVAGIRFFDCHDFELEVGYQPSETKILQSTTRFI